MLWCLFAPQESHKENWKVRKNRRGECDRNESHKENWKWVCWPRWPQSSKAESHKENWKLPVLSAVMQTVFSESHKENWKFLLLSLCHWLWQESHKENWKKRSGIIPLPSGDRISQRELKAGGNPCLQVFWPENLTKRIERRRWGLFWTSWTCFLNAKRIESNMLDSLVFKLLFILNAKRIERHLAIA